MEEKIGKEGETGKDSICWAISAKVGFVSCFGRQVRWRGQVVLMKIFVMGCTFLVQGAILALPSHSGSMKAAHLEDVSAKG